MSGHDGNVVIREAHTIWREQGGWFDARWHFSFDRYRDPEQKGVGALRVFNDDRIVAGAEWPLHPHRDIESLTYVVEGDFLHADSLGNNGHLGPGAAQVMTFSHARRPALGEERLAERRRCASSSSGSCRAPGASRRASSSASTTLGGPDGPLAPDHGTGGHGWPRSVAGRLGTCRPPDRPGEARLQLRSGSVAATCT